MAHPNPHPQNATDWVSIFHGKMLLPLDKHPLHPMGNEVRHARGPRDIFRDMVPHPYCINTGQNLSPSQIFKCNGHTNKGTKRRDFLLSLSQRQIENCSLSNPNLQDVINGVFNIVLLLELELF